MDFFHDEFKYKVEEMPAGLFFPHCVERDTQQKKKKGFDGEPAVWCWPVRPQVSQDF